MKANCWATTDVSRGSIRENLAGWMISIPRMHRPERTMLQFLRGVNRRQRCDFSKDQVGKANFEYLAATCRLPDYLSVSRQQ
jgi:hypothetical protein